MAGIVLEQDTEQIGGPITVTEVNQGMYLAGLNITLYKKDVVILLLTIIPYFDISIHIVVARWIS